MATIIKAGVPGGERIVNRLFKPADSDPNHPDASKGPHSPHKHHHHHHHHHKDEQDVALADLVIREPLPMDPFSVYWRETMRGLIVRKFGAKTFLDTEMKQEWNVLDVVDVRAVLLRVQKMTGVCICLFVCVCIYIYINTYIYDCGGNWDVIDVVEVRAVLLRVQKMTGECICLFVCMYVYIYIYIYIYMYINTYIYDCGEKWDVIAVRAVLLGVQKIRLYVSTIHIHTYLQVFGYLWME